MKNYSFRMNGDIKIIRVEIEGPSTNFGTDENIFRPPTHINDDLSLRTQ